MRVCKLSMADELVEKHGRYAEVMGLIEAPTGMKARLRFPNGHRETVPVQRVRMLQDPNVPLSSGSIFDGI